MWLCGRPSNRTWFDGFELTMMRFFARLWHRCSSTGPDPLPAAGPAIIIANHPSHADPAFLLASCRRPICFLQARECYEVFLLRWLFDRVGCIPVARDGQDIAAVRQALRCLQEGKVLGIFPEGDLTPVAGFGTGEGKGGAALLALRSRAPVYPVWIAGGPRHGFMVRDWLWPSGGVRVHFGPPLDLTGYQGRPITHQLLKEVTELFMRHISQLRPPPNPRPTIAGLLAGRKQNLSAESPVVPGP